MGGFFFTLLTSVARGKLNLIDLAGSERVAKSGALDDEDRFREATNINKVPSTRFGWAYFAVSLVFG